MNEGYHPVSGGLPEELKLIDLDDVLLHFGKYLDHFLLDPAVAVCYINRLLNEPDLSNHRAACECLAYICSKYIKINAFEISGHEIYNSIFGNVPNAALYGYLKKQNSNDYWSKKLHHLTKHSLDHAMDGLWPYFVKTPHNLVLADMLLNLFLQGGRDIAPIVERVETPPPFRADWQRRLFLAYASVNAVPQALDIWESIRNQVRDEVVLNHAAEILVKCGDRGGAVSLYEDSLTLDPRQGPVRRRVRELRSPTVPDKSLLSSLATNIYLYSYNKADILGDTLASLARCDLGASRIKILLNGCTDDSLAVVDKARSFFPNNAFEVLPLPINIGAPAARNWLIAQPETGQADHTVFLDDDVLLEPDFLHHFLTTAASRPNCGVVGCKVLTPGVSPRYQYLYRYIALARPGLLRISLDTPNNQFDNGVYDFVRDTLNVMGCCHMFTRQALLDVPTFDLCFSPSQMDDIAHDFDLALRGHAVVYCGLVGCVHRQMTGNTQSARREAAKRGNLLGNDVKFYYRFQDHMEALARLGQDRLDA